MLCAQIGGGSAIFTERFALEIGERECQERLKANAGQWCAETALTRLALQAEYRGIEVGGCATPSGVE